MSRWIPSVAPPLFSTVILLAGVVLLVSGATPSVNSRLAWLDHVLPLAVIEMSHFLASLAGMGLVLLALGLRRRLDAAYHLAVIALAVGIFTSLLKGLDWEEALLLGVVLALLYPSRRYFYRRAALTTVPFTAGWAVAIVAVLGGVIWLGLFSYRHVAYSDELWWHFALRGDAPRFLRGTVGVIAATVAYALAHLLRPARMMPTSPTAGQLRRVERIAARAGRPDAQLALVGDKALMFGEADDAFLMYSVSGRSWIALGDPIGPPDERRELAWRFRELADRHGGWTVFYQVGHESLPLYIDLGLTLMRLGEEARVPLACFSLEGPERRALRRAHRDVEKRGGAFEIVPAGRVGPLLPTLRCISNAWLSMKNAREKHFSLGRFDESYLRHFPIAVVRVNERIVAFANVLVGGTTEELSVDLMRHHPEAPHGVMDFLFIELMLWGARQGYRWFNFGMAPFSGFERRTLAPLWSHVGALVHSHGEHFYNFRGLRQYKQKFDPVWEPRYLASPGGLAVPRVLANIAGLISGGLTQVLTG